MPTYYTQFNGQRPYRVDIAAGVVSVYARAGHGPDYLVAIERPDAAELAQPSEFAHRPTAAVGVIPAYDTDPIIIVAPDEIFVGRSDRTRATSVLRSHGPIYDGNSILLCVDRASLLYLFIGVEIFTFTTAAPITAFHAPVYAYNSPNPYAVADQHAYLMISKVAVIAPPAQLDPGAYYASVCRILTDGAPAPPPFDNIVGYYVDGVRSELFHWTDPATVFAALMQRDPAPIVTFERRESGSIITHEVSRDEIVELMQEYARRNNIHGFAHRHLIAM